MPQCVATFAVVVACPDRVVARREPRKEEEKPQQQEPQETQEERPNY